MPRRWALIGHLLLTLAGLLLDTETVFAADTKSVPPGAEASGEESIMLSGGPPDEAFVADTWVPWVGTSSKPKAVALRPVQDECTNRNGSERDCTPSENLDNCLDDADDAALQCLDGCLEEEDAYVLSACMSICMTGHMVDSFACYMELIGESLWPF